MSFLSNGPEGAAERSLWTCLHDGEIRAATTDLPNRTVSLTIAVDHLVGTDEISAGVTFALEMLEVRLVGVWLYVPPYPFEEPVGVSRERRNELVTEYHALYRAESFSWDRFESALSTDRLEISNASVFAAEGTAQLAIVGHLDGDVFDDVACEIVVRGRELAARRSDGAPFGLDALVGLGDRYWEAFAARRANGETASD